MEKEERETKKKQWSTPQLIVLVRGRPEEGVLAMCKEIMMGALGPASAVHTCLGNVRTCNIFPCSVRGRS